MRVSRYRKLSVATAVLCSASLVAACGSSSKPSGSSATTSAGASGTSGGATGGGANAAPTNKTYTIGLITDLTGPNSSAYVTTESGVKAGVLLAKSEGYNINIVDADTTSTPTGALTAAQKLVDQNHVMAVLGISGLLFGAAPFLTQKGIPVIGEQIDGPEWLTAKNMFSVNGVDDFTKVSTTGTQFLKDQGATTIGALGYGASPSSVDSTKAVGLAAQALGLKSGFIDANFPFGGTNVQPDVLKMKSAGVDGVQTLVDPNTAFALFEGLAQEDVHLKAALLTVGGGGDLTSSGAAAEQAAQGDFFQSTYEVPQLNTPATQQLMKYLGEAGAKGDPTLDEYIAYVSVAAFVQGLKGAGSNPTSASVTTALSNIHNFDGAGLFGNAFTVDFASKQMAPKQCSWFTKFVGTSFQLVPNAEPICGHLVAGESAGS